MLFIFDFKCSGEHLVHGEGEQDVQF